MKNQLFNIMLVIVAVAVTLLAIAGGAYFRAGLAVTYGEPSTERIRAPHPMDNIEATERNRQTAWELAQGLALVYTIDHGEWRIVENNLRLLYEDIKEIRVAYEQEHIDYLQAVQEHEYYEAATQAAELAMDEWNALRDQRDALLALGQEAPALPEMPETPIPHPAPEFLGESFYMFANLHMQFLEDDRQLLVSFTDEEFDAVWGGVLSVAESVQQNILIDEIDLMTERDVSRAINALTGLDRATETLIENIVLSHLHENAIPNEEENRRRFEEVANNYERVRFYAGEILVDENEIVTYEVYQLLLQYGMLRSDSLRDSLVQMLGVFALIAGLFVLCLMYLGFYHPTIIARKKEAGVLFTVFVLSLALTWVFREFSFPFISLLIFSMLVSLLIDRRCALFLSPVMVLISFFVVEGSLGYLMFYIPAGMFICLLSRFTTERNKVFLVGFLATIIQFALAIAVALIIDRNYALANLNGLFITAGFAAVSGMLTVIICTGSLPFWETLFGVVTPVKLLDLTNPTNILLRRLTIEAPGTYHHSLIVANLAETAAFDIGANAHAARVGGYYHDIGKLKSPHYFVENIDGENPHDLMEPISSAQLIIGHVSYGLKLASEHRLPQFVRDMITQHHGTTMLKYFYVKAKESSPQVDCKDYRYPYEIPQTREAACVMLADSVEAAVRATMPSSNSVDDVEKTIRAIVSGKLNDGQLADSQLSIKDVTVIEQSFLRVLRGMYHERIVYPK